MAHVEVVLCYVEAKLVHNVFFSVFKFFELVGFVGEVTSKDRMHEHLVPGKAIGLV